MPTNRTTTSAVRVSAAGEGASILPPGTLAFLGAAGSLLTCYGTIFAAAVMGIELIGWNDHLQAVIMWLFAAVALSAMWADRKLHGRSWPLAVGGLGVLILLFSLYVHFERSFEILAYVLVVVAALLNQIGLVAALSDEVREQAAEIRELNVRLEAKVERQGHQIERLDRLREFLSPRVADLVVAGGRDDLLDSHRRYIACLFCDIRNFTALSEGVEPEEAIALLQTYHARVGELADRHNGTIGSRAGDGVMVFFNDPIPCEQPVLDAVRLALEIRDTMREMCERWVRLGFPVGVGVGTTAGYATLGAIGTTGGAGYTAIGNPVNVAARLCDQAEDGEILIDQRAYLDIESEVVVEPAGTRQLKGVGKPVECYLVRALGVSGG